VAAPISLSVCLEFKFSFRNAALRHQESSCSQVNNYRKLPFPLVESSKSQLDSALNSILRFLVFTAIS
jgi:hypothetical protein